MARAIGGTVGPGPAPEIGWAPLALTEAGRASPLAAIDTLRVLHWHGEVCALPEGVPSLAQTPFCATQAFAPAPTALGLQFHLEADASEIEPWLVGHAHEIDATPGIEVDALRRDSALFGPKLRLPALKVIGDWLDQAGVGL